MDEEPTVEGLDAEWYLNEYPDVRIIGMSAEEHYEWLGKKLGRKPNSLAQRQVQCVGVGCVDGPWYLTRYPDVAMLNMSAQEHYDWLGERLGRKPNASEA